ncbi:MAG: hypothetical protein QY311_02350 [Candidatus Paceibacterota bacterium]|nr:MAG: hypothetical protein QY311_02350 [Candidatus Paceibacterota bacterium]
MRIVVDREHGARILTTLMRAFREKSFPFTLKKALPPQIPENLPRGGFADNRDHACYLFALCFYMRGGITSDRAAQSLSRIYEVRPELVRPEVVSTCDPVEIRDILARNGLNFNSEEISSFWVENFRRLRDHWDADPRTLMNGVTTFEEACLRIQNKKKKARAYEPHHHGFLGFQEKMVSMLIYFLVEAGFGDPFTFPAPIDFHVLRVMVAHDIVRIIEGGEKNGKLNYFHPIVLSALRDFFSWYAHTHATDPVHLSEVVWGLSRAVCTQHPGNTTVYRGKGGGRKTELTPLAVTWDEAQTRAFERSCRTCPVQDTCRFTIPAAPYYVRGELIIRGLREHPAQRSLF